MIHEWGHYQVARWCGVKVLRFSVGFGRVVWRRQATPDSTEFVISALPLGGYVKMLDEREDSVAPHEREQAFNRKSLPQRVAIVAAGPIANLLLAVLLVRRGELDRRRRTQGRAQRARWPAAWPSAPACNRAIGFAPGRARRSTQGNGWTCSR